MRKVPEIEQSKSLLFLLHIPVLRPDEYTIKTKIVFDASATCHGVSLNEIIHQGPKLQKDQFDILLRLRQFPVALVCVIAEINLQIGISRRIKHTRGFLWREIDQSRKTDVFELDMTEIEVNSSPFQAQYFLQQHARKFKSGFPVAAETILHSTYMVDSIDSV